MRIQKTLNHGNTRWRVTISLHGKRRQRFFTSRDEARAWINSIEADSTGFWSNRTPEEQRDIVSAFNLASKRGVSILGGVSFPFSFQFFARLARLPPTVLSILVSSWS